MDSGTAIAGDEHLGKKAFVLFALERMRVTLVMLVVVLVLSIIADLVRSSSFSDVVSDLYFLTFLVFLGTLGWSYILYKNFSFSFGEFSLTMRSGVFNKSEIAIPYRQIQNADIVRSLSYQAFGLSKLVLLTAGHEEVGETHLTEIVLEPLERERAVAIRDMLERKIGVQIVKDEAKADAETLHPTP